MCSDSDITRFNRGFHHGSETNHSHSALLSCAHRTEREDGRLSQQVKPFFPHMLQTTFQPFDGFLIFLGTAAYALETLIDLSTFQKGPAGWSLCFCLFPGALFGMCFAPGSATCNALASLRSAYLILFSSSQQQRKYQQTRHHKETADMLCLGPGTPWLTFSFELLML